ncbi:restriction endonuclease [Streptomyces sp. WAC05292]|uniref:restriction endonuclease n=1 Tax=Streptomyces sp. WAC05292 TaxID=2487418 RepID=UPI000F741F27|nr:restriction endonuclease [Streptomyces sp. WAC05292]RSS78246.1 restriction endonuclease [Streptomyces sp. WAC05292]
MSTHTVLYDPAGLLEGGLPLDRATHERLAKAVLGWTGETGLQLADLQQIALQLTGAARAVAAEVRRAADQLPADHAARALADVVLEGADRCLSGAPEGTVRCVQGCARLIRALYERLDRLTEAVASRPARAL